MSDSHWPVTIACHISLFWCLRYTCSFQKADVREIIVLCVLAPSWALVYTGVKNLSEVTHVFSVNVACVEFRALSSRGKRNRMESCNDTCRVLTKGFTTKTTRGTELKHGKRLPKWRGKTRPTDRLLKQMPLWTFCAQWCEVLLPVVGCEPCVSGSLCCGFYKTWWRSNEYSETAIKCRNEHGTHCGNARKYGFDKWQCCAYEKPKFHHISNEHQDNCS